VASLVELNSQQGLFALTVHTCRPQTSLIQNVLCLVNFILTDQWPLSLVYVSSIGSGYLLSYYCYVMLNGRNAQHSQQELSFLLLLLLLL